MGAGKSTVAPLVAHRLGLAAVDLDEAVVTRAGRSISEVFAAEGEEGFRAREAAALSALCLGPPVVLALGGGTLHAGDNLGRLKARFRVFVLHAEWPELERRLRADEGVGRPLLGRARSLYQARLAGYQQAGTVIDVTRLTPEEACEAIVCHLEER